MTRDQKVVGSSPGKSGERNFFSRAFSSTESYFGIRTTPRVTTVARKDPSQSSKRGVQYEVEFVNAVPTTGGDFAPSVFVRLGTMVTVVVVIMEVLRRSAVVSVTCRGPGPITAKHSCILRNGFA